jgi:hypothetical protein
VKTAPSPSPRAGAWPEAAPPCRCGTAGAELRCDCGNLLARRVEGGVEVKCRRCKRTVVLPLDGG